MRGFDEWWYFTIAAYRLDPMFVFPCVVLLVVSVWLWIASVVCAVWDEVSMRFWERLNQEVKDV